MDRDQQIELIKSAEVRTVGYFRAWLQRPVFGQAVLKPNPHRVKAQKDKERGKACA